MTLLERLSRRIRYGQPIVVVSGLPRSGTSMAMRMLQAGGLPLLTDNQRSADESNPHGYFEFERVKGLEQHADLAWLPGARGSAVKIISFLLTWLPEQYDYRVLFMRRDIDEVLASQRQMIDRRREQGAVPSGTAQATRDVYERHLEQVNRFVASRKCFTMLTIDYRAVIEQPASEARRIATFLGRGLDVDRMAAAMDRSLYRNRQPR